MAKYFGTTEKFGHALNGFVIEWLNELKFESFQWEKWVGKQVNTNVILLINANEL